MELTLKPYKITKISSISKMFVDGIYECDILEDTVRLKDDVKIFGRTAIPEGRYQIVMTMSTRFKRILPLLVEVPGYEGVRIHPGNTPEDTEGCLLPGQECATKDFVAHSTIEFNQLMVKINKAIKAGQKIYINVNR